MINLVHYCAILMELKVERVKIKWLKVSLAGICVLFASVLLHLLPSNNTMLNHHDPQTPRNSTIELKDEFMTWALDYHQTLPDFKKRPLTSLSVTLAKDTFDCSSSTAFLAVNSIYFFIAFLLLVYLATLYGLDPSAALLSGLTFLLSFTVFLAYFIPIQTYDEPLQYCWIFASLILLHKEKYFWFCISFTFALITRESALLIIPSLFLLTKSGRTFSITFDYRLVKQIAIFLVPVLGYFIYLKTFYHFWPESNNLTGDYVSERFTKIIHNFGTFPNALRTMLSLFSVYLVPIALLIIVRKNLIGQKKLFGLIRPFFLATIINTIVVLFSVFAEEARVLALPIVFIFPILGASLQHMLNQAKRFSYNFDFFLIIAIAGGLSFAFYQGLELLYAKTNLMVYENCFAAYNSISFFLFFSYLLVTNFSRKKIELTL